ncbi:hypothetical protein GBA52_022116 [Prunus armeniaca]|nr:hypothetical protein GBA52_022116 [Prunus armeniaca]
MVSDQEIAEGVETVLRQSGPNDVTSVNGVIQQLNEAKLGLDLSHKAGFIQGPDQLPPPPLRSTATPTPTSERPFCPPHQPQHHYHHHLNSSPNNFLPILPSTPTTNAPEPHSFQQPPPPQQLRPQAQLQPPAVKHGPWLRMPLKVALQKRPKRRFGFLLRLLEPREEVGQGVLTKSVCVSPELQAVVEPALPRTEQLWAYIRKNNLQDPSNKRKIICDDALRVVFETDCTDMFKMNKLLAKHIIPLGPNKESTQAKRLKLEAKSTTDSTEPQPQPQPQPQPGSPTDPLNSTVILCDAKLHEASWMRKHFCSGVATRCAWGPLPSGPLLMDFVWSGLKV